MKADTATTIATLENQLAEARAQRRKELEQERAELSKRLADVETEIAKIGGATMRRDSQKKRMTDDEKSRAIEEVLTHHDDGLSGQRIAEEVGVSYLTIRPLLADRRKFKQTGGRKNRRYFLIKR